MKLGIKIGLGSIKPSIDIGLLDQFTRAVAAYSLRYLTNSYTGDVITVRRSSDNAEQGFTPNEITSGSLTTFCGANDGFLKTISDQIGSDHMIQSDTAKQPKIVSSGSLITTNSLPTIDCSGGVYGFNVASLIVSQPITLFMVAKQTALSGTPADQSVFFDSANTTFRFRGRTNGLHEKNAGLAVTSNVLSTNQLLHTLLYNGANSFHAVNGVSAGSENYGTNGINGLNIALHSTLGTYSLAGDFQELIIYDSDQSANRSAIETAINSYYSIY